MHPSLRKLLLVAAFCSTAAVASFGRPAPAGAYHTTDSRLLDTTAFSLERRQFRLGLFKLSYGFIDRLQITTYTAPWLLGAVLQEVSPNVGFKSTLINRRRFALSIGANFVWGRVLDVDDTTVNYLIFPLSVTASVQINTRISIHVGGQYTATDVVGGAEPADTEVDGVAVVDMLQIYGMFEWRLSRVVALTLTTRWLPYVSNTVAQGELIIDEDTGAIIGIQVDVFDLRNEFAIIPGAVFSWKRANIRVGVGYGALFVESLGLAAPSSVLSSISPELDVFVRF